jgi:hypothetical protein
MEELEKMSPRASERDFFRALRTKWALVLKISSKAGSLRSAGRQGSSPLRGAPLVPRSASLTAILASAPVPSMGERGSPILKPMKPSVIAKKEESW